jgi:uncharacterized protein (TIGR00299 family) protein
MPVPTPGTLELLKGVPLAASKVEFELTTPTGAAILTSVVAEYISSPAMTVERVGSGAGTKDFLDRPNILRLLVGESAPVAHAPGSPETDTVTVLETNLDDVAPEVVGYCTERLFAAGALDVFAVPVQMKKSRLGVLLTVICEPARAGEMEAILFRETATFGVRRHTAERSKLNREAVTVETPWGPVKAKRGWRAGFEVVTPEYDDCARVAREHNVPLRDVYQFIQKNS